MNMNKENTMRNILIAGICLALVGSVAYWIQSKESAYMRGETSKPWVSAKAAPKVVPKVKVETKKADDRKLLNDQIVKANQAPCVDHGLLFRKFTSKWYLSYPGAGAMLVDHHLNGFQKTLLASLATGSTPTVRFAKFNQVVGDC